MNTAQNQVAIVPPAERAMIALDSSRIEAELIELAASTADITAVIDGAGRDQAHRIAMTLRGRRTDIEKLGKAARDDATKFNKAVIEVQDKLVAIIAPEEKRILALRDEYDAEQQRIKDEAIAAERRRMEAHEANIAAIQRMPSQCIKMTADEVMGVIDAAEFKLQMGTADWEEYAERAETAYTEVVAQLRELHAITLAAEEKARQDAADREAERQRIAAEQAALAIQREQQEAQRQELARQQAEIAAQREAAAAMAREAEEARQREASAQEQRALAQAAEVKRQMEEIANARAALEAEKLAASEANQREHDHADALVENAERDAERLARDQEDAIDENALRKALALADAEVAFDLAVAAAEVDTAAVADKLIATTARHLQLPQYDAEPTDEQIVDAYQEAFGGTAEQAITRLAAFAAQYQQEAA